MSVIERLAAAKAAAVSKSEPLTVVVDGELVELIFYRADGVEWANTTARHPARDDVALDRHFAYNTLAVCMEVAPSTGRVLEDGEEVTLTAEQWADLFSLIAGTETSAVVSAIWTLNEWAPREQVAELKKARTATSKRKRNLPAK